MKNKTLTRILIPALAAVLVLSTLTACGKNTTGDDVPAEELTSEEESEYVEAINEISSEFEEYENSLPTLESYTIDGADYHSGDTLRTYLDNGWEILGDAFEADTEVTSDMATEPLAENHILITTDTSLIELGLLNVSQTENRPLSDCVICSVAIESARSQLAQSFAINGIEVYPISTDMDFTLLSDNSSEGSDYVYIGYYPEEGADGTTTAGADASFIGWGLSLNDDDSDGIIDTVIFTADYMYE